MYRLISINGTDAVAFLQGQLTQDVSRVDSDAPLLAAWCNPKGRVIVTMRLVKDADGVGAIMPDDMADVVVRKLTMYRLRAKVEFGDRGDDWMKFVDPDALDLAVLISQGIPTIDSTNTEAHTPHMLNLDKLDAISFDKGCYTGQEVVARTEHRGRSKRRMMRYSASDDGIGVGAKIFDGERTVGEVVNVAGRELLAVTPLELHERPLRTGAVELTPLGLPYAL